MATARREAADPATLQPVVALARYDEACRAIAQAKSVDEARDIRDLAVAMRAYVHQAKNRQLELDAIEIRARAERRIGELIAAQKHTVGLHEGGRPANKTGSKLDPVFVKPTLADAGIDKHLAYRARALASMPLGEFEGDIADWRAQLQAQPTVRIPSQIHFSSKTAEHYTPHALLDAVVACLGAIDLDPCSNDGLPNVPAAQHYTREQNGLALPWNGRIYMNPPYGREIEEWVTKLVAEHRRPEGGVTEAIALVPARTDTQWFIELRDFTCCFVTGRLTFIGNNDPAPFPSAVFYLGDDLGKFFHYFDPFGDIWQRIQPGISFGE